MEVRSEDVFLHGRDGSKGLFENSMLAKAVFSSAVKIFKVDFIYLSDPETKTFVTLQMSELSWKSDVIVLECKKYTI